MKTVRCSKQAEQASVIWKQQVLCISDNIIYAYIREKKHIRLFIVDSATSEQTVPSINFEG